MNHERSLHDPLQPHAHDPNPAPPSPNPMIVLTFPNAQQRRVTVADLLALPAVRLTNCYIISTGHGTSGPFQFTGPTLRTVVEHCMGGARVDEVSPWSQVEVVSGDGFGTRVWAEELYNPNSGREIVLALARDGQPLTREEGLVRLIVPSERDDALRQVKWVAELRVR